VSAGHRHSPPGEHEHEFEAEYGLPEPLPAGERLLWQGSPDWRALAVQCFHVRKLVVYFALILVLRAAFVLSDGGQAADALRAVAWLAPLALLAIAILLVLAWLSARTAVYTLTDRRVVMRIGIVLSLTFNLPFKRIAAAGMSLGAHGSGSLPLTLAGSDKIAYVHLWPHARPWRLARPEPMLVCVPDAAHVAKLLSSAWAAATGLPVQPATAEVTAPVRAPHRAPLLAGH
jgi:hypothetical protein